MNERLYQQRTALTRIRRHLQASDAWRVMMASDLNTTAQHHLCTSGRALSFTTVRNPWERLVSAYLGKIADGSEQAPGVSATPIREKFGIGAEEPISFSRFVRYVADEPDETINVHFLPQSTRCGVGLGRYVIESRIETSFADYVKLMLRAIGKSEDLFKRSTSQAQASAWRGGAPPTEEQIGPKATWQRDSTSEIAEAPTNRPDYDLVRWFASGTPTTPRCWGTRTRHRRLMRPKREFIGYLALSKGITETALGAKSAHRYLPPILTCGDGLLGSSLC